MEIKIEINDKDFTQFAQKTAELGLDPLDTIELINLNVNHLKLSGKVSSGIGAIEAKCYPDAMS